MAVDDDMPHARDVENKHKTSKCTSEEDFNDGDEDDGIETDRECCIFAGLFIVFSLFLSSVVSSELLGSTLGVKSRDDTELEDEDGK